jgi:hypothetical protein
MLDFICIYLKIACPLTVSVAYSSRRTTMEARRSVVKLTLVAGDDSCRNGTCPTVFAIDENPDEAVVQGYVVTDAEALTQLDLSPEETAVRVPRALLLDAAARLGNRS